MPAREPVISSAVRTIAQARISHQCRDRNSPNKTHLPWVCPAGARDVIVTQPCRHKVVMAKRPKPAKVA